MVNRKRVFTEGDSWSLLEAVGTCRRAVIQGTMKAPFGTEIDHALTALHLALDDMAGTLTGNKRHFWNVPHSTHNNPVPPPPTMRVFKELPWPRDTGKDQPGQSPRQQHHQDAG